MKKLSMRLYGLLYLLLGTIAVGGAMITTLLLMLLSGFIYGIWWVFTAPIVNMAEKGRPSLGEIPGIAMEAVESTLGLFDLKLPRWLKKNKSINQ